MKKKRAVLKPNATTYITHGGGQTDRRFFAKNRKRTTRLRKAVRDDLDVCSEVKGRWILIRQAKPGVRQRIPLPANGLLERDGVITECPIGEILNLKVDVTEEHASYLWALAEEMASNPGDIVSPAKRMELRLRHSAVSDLKH